MNPFDRKRTAIPRRSRRISSSHQAPLPAAVQEPAKSGSRQKNQENSQKGNGDTAKADAGEVESGNDNGIDRDAAKPDKNLHAIHLPFSRFLWDITIIIPGFHGTVK